MRVTVVILLMFVVGCHLPLLQRGSSSPAKPASTTSQTVKEVIHSTDKLMTVLIVAAVLGFIAGIQGIKAGFMVTAGAIFGCFMKAALSVAWVYYIAGGVFIAAILVVFASILYKKGMLKKKDVALKELVDGYEELKQVAGKLHEAGELEGALKAVLGVHTEVTQEEVRKIKYPPIKNHNQAVKKLRMKIAGYKEQT